MKSYRRRWICFVISYSLSLIHIFPHINPDGDAFGSGSALFLVLKALRKRVQFVVREQIPFMYRTMPLAPCITKPEQRCV